jgi:hypothetical protein
MLPRLDYDDMLKIKIYTYALRLIADASHAKPRLA